MLRPEKMRWPISIYNKTAKVFGLGERLDFDKIVRKAKSNTGLTNLGADFNASSLRKLIESANAEAQLHPFGCMMIKEKLISQLENRLWAEYWFNKNPEILDQEILPVVLITGLQRTGTTKMQRLLSDLPEARSLLSWEALYPAPIGKTTETKRRISRTRRNERVVHWISPAFRSIHPIHADQPEEDVLLLDVHFMSSSIEAILNVPSYADWLSKQNHEEAYLYEVKLLKLLQWQRGGKFWVLKSPHHLEYLQLIKKIFQNIRIIWMHRSVEASIPSFFSMLYYSRSMFSSDVSKRAIIDHWLAKLIHMIQSGLEFRSNNPNLIIDVAFDVFLNDELSVIEGIIKQIAFIRSKSLIKNDSVEENYISNHKYDLEDWDLDKIVLQEKFGFYSKAVFEFLERKYKNEQYR